MQDSPLFFDKQDYELLLMINTTLDGVDVSDANKKIFDTNLHPHGILEMATSHEYRVAQAVINLLDSLKAGHAESRLLALQALRDEVLHSARSTFRYNTGRVLIQLMKDIVRSRNDSLAQLKLVHDFRRVAKGNPRVVRAFMEAHYLIEMPEEWNQLTLDHHVHDANTKGRKNATHLIMDAWIKGIRYLTVVYYNYVESHVARELLRAAEIMGISVRIGLEFLVPFNGRYINFVWAPRGFADAEAFLSFLAERPMMALMEKGREASLWMQKHVLETLEHWNTVHRPTVSQLLGITLPKIEQEAFLLYVNTGQASYIHLAEYIYKRLLPPLEEGIIEMCDCLETASPKDQVRLRAALDRCQNLSVEEISKTWINPACNPSLPSPYVPKNTRDVPEILRLPSHVMLDWLVSLRAGYRTTLQLAYLTPEDVLELLWDCQGMLTHLELFNLKEWQDGHFQHLEAISHLQQTINDGSVPHMKAILRQMMAKFDEQGGAKNAARCEKFRIISRNISILQAPYKETPLRARIGTDSTSNANMRHGMGLVVPATLPPRGQRFVRRIQAQSNVVIPIHLEIIRRDSYTDILPIHGFWSTCVRLFRHLPFLQDLGKKRTREWCSPVVYTSVHSIVSKQNANIALMGGIKADMIKERSPSAAEKENARDSFCSKTAYLNTRVANSLKLLIGFIPASLAFYATQEWWVLAYGGAIIWFAITGIRNIVQAVLAGGGLGKASLLRWNHYVDWTRICDSLMYTGLSVLLLEWGMRVQVLEGIFGYTVQNEPLLVFTAISIANGIYLSAHNVFRGLQKEAIIGNAFRSILAIPLAMLYYDGLVELFYVLGFVDPVAILMPGTAIVSKGASDTVACMIEGMADRQTNRRLRMWDYSTKLNSVFSTFAQLELAFPDEDMVTLLGKPKEYALVVPLDHKQLYIASIINALDLMYFWLYLPYAQQTFRSIVRKMNAEERLVLTRSQNVLVRVREVSQLYVDGLVGRHFSKALSLYLERSDEYLRAMEQLCSEPSKKEKFTS